MPIFHFNVRGGISDLDHDGLDLPNVDAAWREARTLAAAILKDADDWHGLGEEWHVEVTDSAGLILFRIDITAFRSPLMTVERLPT